MLLNMTILPTQFSPSGEPHRSDAPRFGIRRGCLWDSKEQQRGQNAKLSCSSLNYGTRMPLEQRRAQCGCSKPSCPRGPTQSQVEQTTEQGSVLNPLFNLSRCRSPGPTPSSALVGKQAFPTKLEERGDLKRHHRPSFKKYIKDINNDRRIFIPFKMFFSSNNEKFMFPLLRRLFRSC